MSDLSDPCVLVQELTQAVTDLSWGSETDAPFQVMVWPGAIAIPLTPAQVLALAQLPLESPVVAINLETFFAPVLQPQRWHTATDLERMNRFQTLKLLLQQNLNNLQVYRCGTVESDIFVVGQAPNGAWIVLQTTAVET